MRKERTQGMYEKTVLMSPSLKFTSARLWINAFINLLFGLLANCFFLYGGTSTRIIDDKREF